MERTKPLSQEKKLERILFYLDSAKEAVKTPQQIANGTGLTYRQVVATLNREYQTFFRERDYPRKLRAVGSQYQTYWYSAARCEPIELPF